MESNTLGGVVPAALGLTILFIILRAVNVIDWAWIWVLSPMWITVSVIIILFFICLICYGMAYVLEIISENFQRK